MQHTCSRYAAWNSYSRYLGAGRDGEKVVVVPERDHVRRVRRQPAEIGILLPNNQRDHRTLHAQRDVPPYALC